MSRYLFDENYSSRVAKIARKLYKGGEVDIGWVGRRKGGDPPLGSDDKTVRDHARITKQAIITQDRGMILECVKRNQPVIWIDRKGRSSILKERVKMTVLVLCAIPEWEQHLKMDPVPDIIKTNTRGTFPVTIEEFCEMIENKMKYSVPARRNSSKTKPKTGNDLLSI